MTPAPPVSAWRQDIQGLRGLSAVMIVAYHVWTERSAGGVDVFFVVSGFLLIGSLARQVLRRGTVDLIRYATGIWRRLLPTTFVVTVATVLIAQFLLPATLWDRAIRESLATSLFLENLALIRYSTDYLARDDIVSPFQNGWAISLQIQAFVLIGLLMLLLATWVRRSSQRFGRLFMALGVTSLGSFAYAAIAVSTDPTAAYFDPLARLWQFTIGGLLAVGLERFALPLRVRGPFGWFGLGLLLTTGLLWGACNLFPAWASLWPVAGALLILAAGARNPQAGAGHLFSWSPLVWLGNHAYGLYLWQGPVLVFVLILTGQTRPDLVIGLLILVLSIGLAIFSKARLEKPLAKLLSADQPFSRLTLRAGLMVGAMVLVTGLWALHLSSKQQVQRNQLAEHRLTGHAPHINGRAVIVPGPLVAGLDRSDVFADGCLAWVGDARPLSCRYGPADAPVVIALVGSSHAAQWLPALQRIGAAQGWSIVTYTKASCAFGLGIDDNFGRPAPDCTTWNAAVAERLQVSRPDLVITLATMGKRPPEQITPGSPERWRQLGTAGIPVLALRDTPWFDFDVPTCVARFGPADPRCAQPSNSIATPPLLAREVWPTNVVFVDTRNWLCDPTSCPPVRGDLLIYSDKSHMTATFARSLASRLMPWIDRALSLQPETTSPRPR